MAWVTRRLIRGRPRYTAVYRDPAGRQRSAGTFDSHRQAKLAGRRAEEQVADGRWVNPGDGRINFADFAQRVWLPQLRVEASTLAAYRCYLRAHFLPAFGAVPLNRITPAMVQAWVDQAAQSLSAASVVKYHTMLSGLFRYAVEQRYRAGNPCTDTALPPVPRRATTARLRRILTPAEFEDVLRGIAPRHQLLLLTEIETGLRWGELIALRPADLDLDRCRIEVRRVIVELSRADSPTGQRFLVKDYPKDREARPVTISATLAALLAEHIAALRLADDELLFSFARRPGAPMSRHTFRKRHWLPALAQAGLPFSPTVRDLRHAHASWLLAAGTDLETVKERLGHGWISTTQLYLHSLPGADERAVEALQQFRDAHRRHHQPTPAPPAVATVTRLSDRRARHAARRHSTDIPRTVPPGGRPSRSRR